jgi:hypothetical protein
MIQVDSEFPGGNIVVDGFDGDVVRLHQDLRDTQGWWFYWAFRVRGAQGRQLTFRFGGRRPVGPRGPAVSRDNGQSWSWLGADAVTPGDAYTDVACAFAANEDDVRFCFAIPYLEHNLTCFCAAHPGIETSELCRSRKGRKVELLTAGAPPGTTSRKLMLTARHHACESLANYVMEGVLQTTAADDELGRWYAENVTIRAVPFVDKDGVEDGDQGKNRKPRDHNRDYKDESIYPETAAIRRIMPPWLAASDTVTMDLHCPHIDGKTNTRIYIVGSQCPRNAAAQARFASLVEAENDGPLPFFASDLLSFGTSWNTAANFSQGKSCGRWAAEQDGVGLAVSLEIPYATVYDTPVTADSARQFGAVLARTLRVYWHENDMQGEQ